MKAKLAGLALLSGMSLAASAASFNFIPVTEPGNTVLQSLGKQLTMEVTSGGGDNVLFTFTNRGSLESSISRVFFDDAPSNLFSSFTVANQSPGVQFVMNTDPAILTDASADPYRFWATESAQAVTPRFVNGVNDTAEAPGEFLTLSGILNAGKTFADVVASLAEGPPTQGNLLRVGLRAIGINQFNDSGSASFLDTGPGSGPTAPIPESSTYGMLLAGLGLITAIARRRQSGH
ncbi:MAG TPA: PEP-CTERM sorting domain-containing protein [Rhodocyclaceae bacterium]|nr:PEP-CTERM sorting domain-containing protein [Rhodocyclaceae bacterium]